MMSQEAAYTELPHSGAGDVALCVDRLIKETNEDLKNFRTEQSDLRGLISAVLNENRQLSGELGEYKKAASCGATAKLQERLNMTKHALEEALAQIEELKKDRQYLTTAQEWSQRTIENMEMELRTYRAQMSQPGDEQRVQTYSKAVKLLEARLSEQQKEMRTQSKFIKALHEHKQRCGQQIEKLQSQLKERHSDVAIRSENQHKVAHLQKQLKELEKSLLQTRSQLDESKRREMEAMRRVQDAIVISEAAVHEKVEADRRANSYKEEVCTLSVQIGTIMDEAALKADNELAQLRSKLAEKDKTIAAMREKCKRDTAELKKALHQVESVNNRLNIRYKGVLEQNEKLGNQMESCQNRLIEMEQCTYETKKDYESQMKKFLSSYKELKTQYKELLHDLTKRFENDFYNLQKEKTELQAENEMLRSRHAEIFYGTS